MESAQERILKLQQSLLHWQKWEAEYEALKDEIEDLKECTAKELIEIAQELGSDLVTAKEIEDLTTNTNGTGRSVDQITNALARRVEYNQKNALAVQRMLEAAKEHTERPTVESDVDEKITYPLTEIREDLDEEGNIISSGIFQPKDEKPEILETLRKAGLTDLKPELGENQQEQADADYQETTLPIRTGSKGSAFPSENLAVTMNEGIKDEKENHAQARSKKRKKVSFAALEGEEKQAAAKSTPYSPKSEISDFSFNSGSKVLELDDEDNPVRATPVFPLDESPEDAALRREMIEYSLNEVEHVVAELDLCEDDEFSSVSEESGSDVEDKHGRRLGGNINPSYRAQMLELQRKVDQSLSDGEGNSFRGNKINEAISESKDNVSSSSLPEPRNASVAPQKPRTKPKKSLRFADKVEIHHLPKEGRSSKKSKKSNIAKNTVVEHQPTKTDLSKATQASQKRPAETLSATVVEREIKERTISEPSDLDTEVLLREARANYYDIRNRAIERQGGFMPSEEEEDNPLMEEHDGKVRKVSRFKAARLKPANA